MSMMQRLVSALGLKQNLPPAPEAEQIMAALLPGDIRCAPERAAQGMLEAYSTSPWVRAVSSKVAQAVGSVQWQLYATKSLNTSRYLRTAALQATGIKRKQFKRKMVDLPEGVELVQITDHPMLGLLNNAAMAFPGNVGRTLTQLYLELVGEAFWLLEAQVVQGRLVPQDFWLVPPTWVKSVPTAENRTFRVEPAGSHQGIDIPMELMLWMVDPNPVNPYKRGTGLLRALGDEIDTDEFASKHVRAWFYNSARPDLLVTGDNLAKADTERLEAKWMQRVGGFLNRWKPLFLGAAVQVKELSQKFSDMQLTDLRKWERDIIIHTVGMPPEILGIIESSNRATIDAADYLFAKHVVEPRLEFFRAYLQTHLVPMYDDRLILGYESPVEENADFQLEVAKSAPWSLELDEWRAMGGWDPLPDDKGKVHLVKLTEQLLPIDQVSGSGNGSEPAEPEPARHLPAAPPALPAKATPCTCGEDHGTLQVPISEDLWPLLDDNPVRAITTAWATAAGKAIAQAAGIAKQVGGPEVSALADALGTQVVEDLLQAFDQLRGQLDMQNLVAALERGDIDSAAAIIDQLKVDESLEDAKQSLKAAVLSVADEAARELGEVLGADLTFDMLNPAALQELEQFGAGMVTNVKPETIEGIRKVLVDAYAEGKSPSEVAREIRDSIGLTVRDAQQKVKLYQEWIDSGMSVAEANEKLEKWVAKKIKDRAETIATYELKYAGNRGQEMMWEAAAQNGLLDPDKTMRQWILTNDEHLCALCSEMVGDRAFARIGGPWDTPKGDVYTPQDIHVRCRCAERLVFLK